MLPVLVHPSVWTPYHVGFVGSVPGTDFALSGSVYKSMGYGARHAAWLVPLTTAKYFVLAGL